MKALFWLLVTVSLLVSVSAQSSITQLSQKRQEIKLEVLMRALENLYKEELLKSPEQGQSQEGDPKRNQRDLQDGEAEEEQEMEETDREEGEEQQTTQNTRLNNLMTWFEFEMFMQKIPKVTEMYEGMCEELLVWLESGYLRQWFVSQASNNREERTGHFLSTLIGRQLEESDSGRGRDKQVPRRNEEMVYWQTLIRSCSAYQRVTKQTDEENETEQEDNEHAQE